jgi:hypothetical protein
MSKRVLLIDYEPRSLERVRSLLPSDQYTIAESHDGEEGFRDFPPPKSFVRSGGKGEPRRLRSF